MCALTRLGCYFMYVIAKIMLLLFFRTCRTVKHLPEVAKGIRDTKDFKQLQEATAKQVEKLKTITKDRERLVHSFKDISDNIQTELDEFHDKLAKLLRKLHTNATQQLEKISNNVNVKLNNDIGSCNEENETAMTLLKIMKDEEDHPETSAFIAYKKCKDKLLDMYDMTETMTKDDIKIIFEANTKLEAFLNSLTMLGDIKTGLDNCDSGKQANVYQITAKKEHLIAISSDRMANEIWGSCQLPDGSFVIIDTKNQKVKLLTEQFGIRNVMDISPMYPNDVSYVGESVVAVSAGGGNGRHEVWYIDTRNDLLVLSERLKFDHICGGIVFRNGLLYLASATDLYVYTRNGKLVEKLYSDTSGHLNIFHFAVSYDGQRIYLTNMDRHQLITLDGQGNRLVTFSDLELKRPTGVCVAANRTVFVCSYDKATVIQVDANGRRKLATIATYANGIYAPYSLTFVKKPLMLIVGQVKDSILEFDLA